jgi:hypothetical protein
MLKYPPPRRRRNKSVAKAATRNRPGRFRMTDEFGTLFSLLVVVTALRVAVGFTVAPLAVPGDRVIFLRNPAMFDTRVMTARLVSGPFAPAGAACQLDLRQMSESDGAMTVMAVRADGVMVSWAGGPTAPVNGCQNASGEILLAKNDYAALDHPAPLKR